MLERRRLTPRELGIVKFLARHQGAGMRFVLMGGELRTLALPLWREGLIEIWYRQMADEQPSLRGPNFSWSGDRWWIVALSGEIVGDDQKLGALSREIIGECL